MQADSDEAQQYHEEQEVVRNLLNRYDLGEEAQQFLNSRLGRYLAHRAQEAMYQASLALTTVAPTDMATIIEHQRQYAVASQALSWVAQAIEDGKQAAREAEARSHTD